MCEEENLARSGVFAVQWTASTRSVFLSYFCVPFQEKLARLIAGYDNLRTA